MIKCLIISHLFITHLALTFTSLGVNFDRSLLDGSGPNVLKLFRELYHNHGVLIPNENRDVSYAQLYIYDSQMALNQRMNRNSRDGDTMSHLQDMLLEHNPFVPLYKQAAERLREQGATLDVQVRLTYLPYSNPVLLWTGLTICGAYFQTYMLRREIIIHMIISNIL